MAVAAILAMEPGIVIFDEASSMLDEKARGELLDIIKEMKQSGEYTIVSITHDAEEIMYSDRAIVLLDGGVAADLSPEDLFHDDALLQSCRLIAPYRIQLVRELARLGVQVPSLQREEEVTEALWQLHLNK
ncbi:Energy-coupling factor transporter ATP-binding protein EcfA1 [compost metagenome]